MGEVVEVVAVAEVVQSLRGIGLRSRSVWRRSRRRSPVGALREERSLGERSAGRERCAGGSGR